MVTGCGDGSEGGMKSLAGEVGRADQFMGSAWVCGIGSVYDIFNVITKEAVRCLGSGT